MVLCHWGILTVYGIVMVVMEVCRECGGGWCGGGWCGGGWDAL